MIITDHTIKPFLNENFLLETKTAQRLYHEFAKVQPIIDYHCHLSPADIATDRKFNTLTEIWLKGDHYKWRAMRANGIDEHFITGDASDLEKFEQWAATVPYTMRNPLYHWTHLELKRYFGVTELLNERSARNVYEQCTEKLQDTAYSTRNLLSKMKVEIICTTDDPIDDLGHHRALAASDFEINVLPAFRPDKSIFIEKEGFREYIEQLGEAAGINILHWQDLLAALNTRIDFFHEMGGRVADHGLEQVYATDYSEKEIETIFSRRMAGREIYHGEALNYMSALIVELGKMYHSRNWTQQFHLGALRNNNRRRLQELGPDTGFDSIGDFSQADSLSRLLDRLDGQEKLTKTILYNLNPSDNEIIATMLGNFNDGKIAGKMQFGSGWWFLDQKDGMEKQINTLSNMGLLSRFVGMLTDSRSFLSYPRHEYFRRILCNLFGRDIENGELPNDINWIGKLVADICYFNAAAYFQFPSKS